MSFSEPDKGELEGLEPFIVIVALIAVAFLMDFFM